MNKHYQAALIRAFVMALAYMGLLALFGELKMEWSGPRSFFAIMWALLTAMNFLKARQRITSEEQQPAQ